MAISWRLKSYLAQNHSIYGATQLQKKIRNVTGIIISVQNLSNYLNAKPKAIRLETMQIICTALNCQLTMFCKVSPDEGKEKTEKKLSYNLLSAQNETHFPRIFKQQISKTRSLIFEAETILLAV